jgi:hypothetical protein
MTHFLGAGTIASDIVRKETRNGVLATFRLRSGAKGRGQVWIDVEAWGHLAGTVHQHGRSNRPVIVAGRLTQKTWHDRDTGEARHRYVITASDIDLLPDSNEIGLTNTVVAFGTIDTPPTTRPAGTGTVTEFRLAAGRAGSKTGRLWIDIEHWHHEPLRLNRRAQFGLVGHLAFGPNDANRRRYYIDATDMTALPAHAEAPDPVGRLA